MNKPQEFKEFKQINRGKKQNSKMINQIKKQKCMMIDQRRKEKIKKRSPTENRKVVEINMQ